MIEPGSAKSMMISLRRPSGTSLRCALNIRSGGSWKPSVITCRPAPRLLPDRRKNGTPCQRQLSTSAFTATIVSVCESGRDARLVAVALVLAAHDVPDVDRPERVEHLLLLGPQLLRCQRRRRLHGDEAEHLEQVRDDHVAVGAGLVVEVGAALDGQRLRHVDLHVGDVRAVPDRLEQAVGEPEGQDVVDRLLAEEVVDPEDLRLVEDRVHGLAELDRGLAVGAERLLDDHPRLVAGQAGVAEHADHGRERRRRDGEVEEPPG